MCFSFESAVGQTVRVSTWCNLTVGEVTIVNVTMIAVAAEFAVIRWDKFNTSDARTLLSWIVNYREA